MAGFPSQNDLQRAPGATELEPAWSTTQGFSFRGFRSPTVSGGCPIPDCVHCAAESAEKERDEAIQRARESHQASFANWVPRPFWNIVPHFSTTLDGKPARLIRALLSLILSLLSPVLLGIIGLWDLRFGKISRRLINSQQQKSLSSSNRDGMLRKVQKVGRSAEKGYKTHQSLAKLDLYEATIRPDETQEFVGVSFNTRTGQWNLARGGGGGEPCEQIKRIKARGKQVLLLCSEKLAMALALGAVGKSTIVVKDYKGETTSSQTTITALSGRDGIPKFRGGELSRLRLSSQDVFDIHNLEEFLLYARYNIRAVSASSRGQCMKSWLVTLPQVLDIMKHGSTGEACKEAFWKLYSRGSACNIYLSVPDRVPFFDSGYNDNAEISHVEDWLRQQGTASPGLCGKVEQALSFFSAERLPCEVGMNAAMSSPFLCIISPRATPTDNDTVEEGNTNDTFRNLARRSVAQCSPERSRVTTIIATPRRRRRRQLYPPNYPNIIHPMPYPQRPEPEKPLTDWEAGWHREAVAAELREQHAQLPFSTNGSTAPTDEPDNYQPTTEATTNIQSYNCCPSFVQAPWSPFPAPRCSTPSAITFEDAEGLTPATARAARDVEHEHTASSPVSTTPFETRWMEQLDNEREHGAPPRGTSFNRQFEATENARGRLEEMGMMHDQDTNGSLNAEEVHP